MATSAARRPAGRRDDRGARDARREDRQDRRAPAKEESREVATRKQTPVTELPRELSEMASDYAGAGVSTAAEDNLIPLMYVLQPLSPQINGQDAIEGAQPGDIWLRNANDPIVPGDEGVYFMPVLMRSEWTEWVPRERGGGFAGRHPYDGGRPPTGAKAKPRDGRRPQAYTLNGNELIDSRQIPGVVWRDGLPLPFVIPFKSTGHSVAKGWNSKWCAQQQGGRILPAWFCVYKLTTVHARNALGEWYKLSVGEPVPIWSAEGREIVGGDTARAAEIGRALHVAFQSGEKQAGEEADVADEPSETERM